MIIGRKVPGEVHAVMEHTADFEGSISCYTVQQEMPGATDTPNRAAHMVAAVVKVVRLGPCRQFRPMEGSGPGGIGCQVHGGLNQQFFVAKTDQLAELSVRPRKDGFNVLLGFRGKSKPGHRLLLRLGLAGFGRSATHFGDSVSQPLLARNI